MENMGLDSEMKEDITRKSVLAIIIATVTCRFFCCLQIFLMSCLGPGGLGGFCVKSPQEIQVCVRQEPPIYTPTFTFSDSGR